MGRLMAVVLAGWLAGCAAFEPGCYQEGAADPDYLGDILKGSVATALYVAAYVVPVVGPALYGGGMVAEGVVPTSEGERRYNAGRCGN